MGIKICANGLDSVVAGSACLVPYADVPYDLEVLKEDVMSDLNKLAKAASEVNGGIGVYAIASTLGSLEALLEFLKTSKIPVSAVNIGPIHKKDVMKASHSLSLASLPPPRALPPFLSPYLPSYQPVFYFPPSIPPFYLTALPHRITPSIRPQPFLRHRS